MEQDSSFAVSDAISRLRLLERRQESLREKLVIINQNMVEEYKKILFEVRTLVTDIREIKSNMFAINESVKQIIKESESFAKKDQLRVLEKYINLLNPLDFVTEHELQAILKKRKNGPRKKISKRKHR